MADSIMTGVIQDLGPGYLTIETKDLRWKTLLLGDGVSNRDVLRPGQSVQLTIAGGRTATGVEVLLRT